MAMGREEINDMNSIEKIHPTQVQGLTPTKELGRDIVALRYDLALPVIEGMIEEFLRQERGDMNRGRIKLAKELGEAARLMSIVKAHIEKIISICAPYIEKEKNRP
jgi:hypothetical protein